MPPAFPRPFALLALASAATLAACVTNQAAPVVEGTPGPSPSAGPTAPAATAPASPEASPAAPATPFFRDDFDGDRLDPAVWNAFERDGRLLVRGGRLELLVPGLAATAPMVLPTRDILPPTGPYYVEARYAQLTPGRVLGFNLDYLPPTDPADPGLTEPFMRWVGSNGGLQLQFQTEGRPEPVLASAGTTTTKVPHRFRLEFDGASAYRAILDGAEIARIESRRRPTRLWFGPWPNRPVPATAWATLSVDAIEAGTLTAPEPATPLPTPTPAASPTASPPG